MDRVVSDEKGFSLIELLVALVIMMVTMLALLTAILNSMNVNAANDMRNTAIRLTNQTAEALLSVPFEDSLVSAGSHERDDADATQTQKGVPLENQAIRKRQVAFDLSWNVLSQTGNVKQITITVAYTIKGQAFSNVGVVYKNRAI
jgi:prepilin-type N-terminal cleavage/methylation domain-containing protein